MNTSFMHSIRNATVNRGTRKALIFVVSIMICILLHALIMLFLTDKPLDSYVSIFKGAFSSPFQISETLNRILPLAMMGLAISISLRANILFFGGNACVLAGGIGASIIALNFDKWPNVLVIPTTMLFAMAFGVFVAAITGILRAYLGINEIYVSVMLNYILAHMTSYLVESVWTSWEGLDYSNPICENAKWSSPVKGMNIHWGFVLLLVLIIAVVYLNKTPLGFRIKAFGQSNPASLFRYKETANRAIILFVVLLVGLVAGLVGATSLCTSQFRFSKSINDNYGFTGIVVARLGGLNPVGILIAATLLGILRNGAITMQVFTGVPVSIVTLLEGLLLLGALCADHFSNRTDKTTKEKKGRKI